MTPKKTRRSNFRCSDEYGVVVRSMYALTKENEQRKFKRKVTKIILLFINYVEEKHLSLFGVSSSACAEGEHFFPGTVQCPASRILEVLAAQEFAYAADDDLAAARQVCFS